MIDKIKKVAIAITIAVLFTVLVFATTNAIYPQPDYADFCDNKAEFARPLTKECGDVLPQAVDCRGPINYEYDEEGCPISAECNDCWETYDNAQEKYQLVLFLVSAIAGIIAALFGLYFDKKGEFWEVTKAGFIIGGLASIFIGTTIYYQDMGRFLKPLVILIELVIVLLVTKKVLIKDKKKK